MAAREKKSCWQCYKLHFADASLFIDGANKDPHIPEYALDQGYTSCFLTFTVVDCKDKPFCNEKCLDNFKRKQAEKEAKKTAKVRAASASGKRQVSASSSAMVHEFDDDDL